MKQEKIKQIKLTIVIAAWNGITHLTQCLSSLEVQLKDEPVEVIVVSNFETTTVNEKSKIEFIRFINLSDKTSVPKLFFYGIAQAQGDYVAITEDFCLFDPAWYQETKKMYDSSYSAVGGTIENSENQNILDWAVFLYDYGKYMSPNKAGVTDTLSGANILYRREKIKTLNEKIKDEFFETFVNSQLISQGNQIYLNPAMIIYHNKQYELKRTVIQYYHQARTFAAHRVLNSTITKRVLLTLVSPILPFLLTFRIISRTLNKKRHLNKLILALPYLAILMTTWSFGELSGYLIGEGKSGNKWR